MLVRRTQLFHFPFSILCTYSKRWEEAFCFSLPHTRLEATIELSWRGSFLLYPSLQPPTCSSNKAKWKSFRQGKDFLLLRSILVCREKGAQILVTLTLNENEVTINYIKYEILYFFSVQRSSTPSSSFECYRKMLLHASRDNLPMPLNLISVRSRECGEMTAKRNVNKRCTKVPRKTKETLRIMKRGNGYPWPNAIITPKKI